MARSPYEADEDWDAGEELALIEREERLPWLDSGDEDGAAAPYDTGRIMLIGALALTVLVALVGGIWFVTRMTGAGGPEPDGSVIAAPEGPYKVRPSDAGGKTFAGTGDTSFAVGEGQVREGQLASKPAPAPTAAPSVAPTAAKPEPAPAATPAASGVGVQVGAFPRRADAEAGWAALVRQTEALAGVSHRVVEGTADIGRVYRLQAVAGDRAAAQRLCAALKADGIACFVK